MSDFINTNEEQKMSDNRIILEDINGNTTVNLTARTATRFWAEMVIKTTSF